MKRICLLLLLMAVLSAPARLTFTQRLQQKAASRVLLRQDKDIDLLVNGREADPATAKVQTEAATPNKAEVSKNTPAKPHTNANTSPLQPKQGLSAATSPVRNTPAKPSAYTTATGWRVKFFTGGSSRVDKENAQNAGREFKRLFPDTPVYMHFVSPHWICVAGDFIHKEDADAFISKVRSTGQFNTAGMTVMKSRVKVPVE